MSEDLNFESLFAAAVVRKSANRSNTERQEWLKERCGYVNGSKCSDVMSCGRGKHPEGWGYEKIYNFGATFETRAKILKLERQYGYSADGFEGSSATAYGHIVEPYIIEMIGAEKCDDSLIIVKDVLRCTPDFVIRNVIETIAGEIKAATNWSTYASRAIAEYNNKHTDYWQHVAEMLALRTNKLRYITALPARDLRGVLNGDLINNVAIGHDVIIDLNLEDAAALLFRSACCSLVAQGKTAFDLDYSIYLSMLDFLQRGEFEQCYDYLSFEMQSIIK